MRCACKSIRGKVSIIIPNLNRDLERLFASIEKSDYPYEDIEIIVINKGEERSKQRNRGARIATGDYFFFLDSDQTIHPELISKCVALCHYHDGIYIPEIIVGHPIKTFFRQFYNGSRIDAVRFIRKGYWQAFDENLTGVEDWDWDRRFTGSKGIVKCPLYHHTKSNLRRKLYYMKWLPQYIKKYPQALLFELNPFYRLWLIIRGIWKKYLL